MESYTLLANDRPVCEVADVQVFGSTVAFTAAFRKVPAGLLSLRRNSDQKSVPIVVNKFGLAIGDGLGQCRWGALALL